MDLARTLGHSIGAVFWILIAALIFAAIVHFLLGDNIWAVLIFYMAVAFMPRIVLQISDSRSSGIIGSIFTVVIVFLIITFIFPFIFGQNIGFPYSMLDLGPIVTGLIVSILVDLISVSITTV